MKKQMQDALNKQVARELSASYAYFAMSLYLDGRNFPGAARWMEVQSEEERTHARMLIEYITDRNCEVILETIPQPTHVFESVLSVFKSALAHEEANTAAIHEMYALAKEIGDYATEAKLQWFLSEQVEEEKTAMDLVAQWERAGEEPSAMLILDQAMATERTSS